MEIIAIVVVLVIGILLNKASKKIQELKEIEAKITHYIQNKSTFIYVETVEENNQTMYFAYNYLTKAFIANAASEEELSKTVVERLPDRDIFSVKVTEDMAEATKW